MRALFAIATLTLMLAASAIPAEARRHHHKHRHHHHHSHHHVAHKKPASPVTSGHAENVMLIRIDTAAGRITVSAEAAASIAGFVSDVVAREPSLVGHVFCYARSGHMRNSLHYRGDACDVAQTARNKTAPVMYDVAEEAKRWDLRDGCSFRRPDCGHIELVPRRANAAGHI